MANPPSHFGKTNDTQQVSITMGCALGFGVLAVILSLAENGTIWRGLLWAAAWSSVGWFLGFLFGIPRYLSTDTARTMAPPGAAAPEDRDPAAAAKVKSLREAATKANSASVDANATAKAKADAVDLAKAAADAAADLSSANPADPTMKTDADTKATALAVAVREREAADAAVAAEAANAATAESAAKAAESDLASATAIRKVAPPSVIPTSATGASLSVNTNLEQISDWLTKIIVGVSLVESQALLDKIQKAAHFMAQSMASVEASATASAVAASEAAALISKSTPMELSASAAKSLAQFAAIQSLAHAMILYFLASGLLGSYLLTRLFLQRALENAAKGEGVDSSTP